MPRNGRLASMASMAQRSMAQHGLEMLMMSMKADDG
jgi:hypothetical protein